MTTTTQHEAIEKHGRNLLAIFPRATETDPVKLCKKLRRLEAKAYEISLQACNGPDFADGEEDRRTAAVLQKVTKLLGGGTAMIFLNKDARGYALKIDDEWMRARPDLRLHTDWGGYGILAPEIGKDGH